MAISIPFKRGDTFLLQCTATQSDGSAQDISTWSIRSHVRAGSFVDSLTVEFVDAVSGVYLLRAEPEETKLWPTKALQCDIEYTTASGQVVSTETFVILVGADVTI